MFAEISECQHFTKAIDINKLRKVAFAKKLSLECIRCKKKAEDENPKNIKEDSSHYWICLRCAEVLCGKDHTNHVLEHLKAPRSDLHCLVMDTEQWRVWCYSCDDTLNSTWYVHSSIYFINSYD